MTAALESQRPSARVPLSLAFALGALIVTAIVVNRAPAPHHAPATATPPAAPVSEGYTVAATFLRHDGAHVLPLASGDRVRPGDHVSLEVRASRPAWIYVLDEDERGERYLLFPQPRFDAHNPIRGDSSRVLPGTVDGKEYAWTVTSAGGREYLLVVASPAPVAEIEADLQRLPRSQPGRPIAYAPVGPAAVERLRGIGGLDPVTGSLSAPTPSRGFDRFVALAGRETDVHGIWVRRIVLENPSR